MLLDKAYYDYDYSEEHRGKSVSEAKYASRPKKSPEQVQSLLARFGFRTKVRGSATPPADAATMQAIVMSELRPKPSA